MFISNKARQAWFLLLLTGILLACQPDQSEPRVFKSRYFVFGTVLDVLVWAPTSRKTALEDALLAVETRLNDIHRHWHAWKPGRLQAINKALRAGKAVKLSAEEARLLRRARELSLASGGTFDPAIGELVHLWGFHADEFPLRTPPPSPTAISRWLKQRPGMADLILENDTARSLNPHIWLDLGGIAKGYAADVAASILHQAGFDSVIINAGGDVLVAGHKGAQPWRVAVQAPDGGWDGPVLGVIESQGREAIFTSGNYQRYREFEGKRYAHILDPASGWPVDRVASATVIAANGILADAAATAMVVAGWDKWPQVAARLGVDSVLVLGENARCEATQAMIRRLKESMLHCRIRPLATNTKQP